MLIEGLVGVVAMIAAATLPVGDYYAMNTELAKGPRSFTTRFIADRRRRRIEHLNVLRDAARRNRCAAAPAGR